MQFERSNLYHVYNRGNNKQPIFFNRENYLYFLGKVKKNITTACDILAWCLMPNHFHFLIHANSTTCKLVKEFPLPINTLTEGIRLLLSSYTQGVNAEQNGTGSLFQKKTRAKCLMDGDENYGYTVFQYIHQNAYQAGLVDRIEDWEFSSFPDYAGLRKGTLCNIELARALFDLDDRDFKIDPYKNIPDSVLRKIF